MAAPQITRISILPFGMVNAHLIRGAGGCILVDAGLPGSESKIEKALTQHGLSFKDINSSWLPTLTWTTQGVRMHCVNCLGRLLWLMPTMPSTLAGKRR